jgi:hypothetical protein
MFRSRIGSISVSRIVAVGFFALTSARAQVTASFSVQPLETWKAAIGKRLPGTAVYDATVCNAGQATVVIPAGRVFTAARTKISTVSPLLVANTLSRSQDKTVAARTLEILGFFVWGIGVATISDSLKIPDNAKIALPLIGEALAHVGGVVRAKVPSIDRSAFLEGPLALGANACESRLMLGEYRKDVAHFDVAIQ